MTDQEIVIAAAEKVCGWERRWEYHSEGGWWHAFWGGRLTQFNSDGTIIGWNPLTSISDAWMLVEVLVAKGYEIQIRVLQSGPFVRIWRRDGSLNPVEAFGKIPDAITRASLKAIGEGKA